MTNSKCILTLAWMLTSLCSASFLKYHVTNGSVTLQQGCSAFTENLVDSVVQCAVQCSNTYSKKCSVAHYNATTSTCQLFNWKDVSTLVLGDNTTSGRLLIGPDPKNLYLQHVSGLYMFTFSEGLERCNGIGGRLSTPTELETARTDGWEICACGWVDNGQGYFAVSTVTPACGTTQLHQCTYKTYFGAHCKFV